MNEMEERLHIEQVLVRYAEACDRRDWGVFEEVFHEDVIAHYGTDYHLHGRTQVVAMIRSLLGGCGPTQHLLGNFRITVHGRQADSRCYVRAVHAGRDANAGKLFEVWGEYADHLVLDALGWRILRRSMQIFHATGTREVLVPG